MSWELIGGKGFSFDVISTSSRAGVGLSKDIYKNKFTEIDIGAYVTSSYDSINLGKLEPKAGFGINISF